MRNSSELEFASGTDKNFFKNSKFKLSIAGSDSRYVHFFSKSYPPIALVSLVAGGDTTTKPRHQGRILGAYPTKVNQDPRYSSKVHTSPFEAWIAILLLSKPTWVSRVTR
jgi:hypothetical protein